VNRTSRSKEWHKSPKFLLKMRTTVDRSETCTITGDYYAKMFQWIENIMTYLVSFVFFIIGIYSCSKQMQIKMQRIHEAVVSWGWVKLLVQWGQGQHYNLKKVYLNNLYQIKARRKRDLLILNSKSYENISISNNRWSRLDVYLYILSVVFLLYFFLLYRWIISINIINCVIKIDDVN
jgi:hypothetical protein